MHKKNLLVTLLSTAAIIGSTLALPALAQTTGPGRGMWGGRLGHFGQMQSGVFGKVTTINGTTLTVTDSKTNTTYSVDASSARVDKNRAASTLSAIAVGDMVMLQGTVNGTTMTATAIHDGIPAGDKGMLTNRKPGVVGTVTAINGTTLTITSKKVGPKVTPTAYLVDASAATVEKDGATSSLSSVAVGDMVMVTGTVNGTSITATDIREGVGPKQAQANALPEGNGQPIVAGTVSAVNGATLTLTNKSSTAYTVDASTATVTKNGKIGTVADVVVGDTVLVQGTVNGTSVTAASIRDQSAMKNNANGTTQAQPRGLFSRIGNFFTHLFGL